MTVTGHHLAGARRARQALPGRPAADVASNQAEGRALPGVGPDLATRLDACLAPDLRSRLGAGLDARFGAGVTADIEPGVESRLDPHLTSDLDTILGSSVLPRRSLGRGSCVRPDPTVEAHLETSRGVGTSVRSHLRSSWG